MLWRAVIQKRFHKKQSKKERKTKTKKPLHMPVPLAPITLVRLNNRCKPRFHNQGIILSYISRRWGCKAGVGGVTWRTITSLNLKKASKLKTIPSAALSKKKKSNFFAHERRKKSRKIKQLKPVIKRLQSLSLKQVHS